MAEDLGHDVGADRVRRRRRSTPWRRFQRKLRRQVQQRPRVAVLAGVGLVVVLGILWTVWVVWSTSRDLTQARDSATIMRAALVRADADGARAAMADFADASGSASDRTSGLTWSLLEALPLFGDDAEGISTASDVLDDIARQGLPPVVDAADLVTADTFRPTDGTFPVEAIAAMEAPAAQSEKAFADAQARLDALDADSFVGPVHRQFEELDELVADARATLGSTYRAARIIPRMMGTDRPRHYLMVLQNNAEMRSSGGLPGALTLVRMHQGKVEIVDQADMSEIAVNTAPLVTLTQEERDLFGRVLGLSAVDAGLTPDLDRTAEIISKRWVRARGGTLDGLFFVDPVAVSYLMRGVGPVAVPGYPEVDATTVVAALENVVYTVTNDRSVHSDYQQAVAQAVFDAFAAGRGDTATAIQGLVSGVAEGRIRMHSFEPETQAEIAGTVIAGEFTRAESDRPGVGIYLNDSGPSKMQFYLTYEASVVTRSCEDDTQVIAGTIKFHSDTPPNAAELPDAITGRGFPGSRIEPGQQRILVYLTGPVGGAIDGFSVNGQASPSPNVRQLDGHPVVAVPVLFEPQAHASIDFEMRGAPGQTGDVDLWVTPGAFPSSSNGSVPNACAVR